MVQQRDTLTHAAGYSRVPVLGVAALMVIVGGLVADANKADGDNFYANILRLDNVATKIHQSYVEDVESGELVDEAIEGMIGILDPHTSYFREKQYEELRIQTEGEFGGLGIQIAIRDKVLTVMTPISGTPASRAGIQSGDQILKIDGKSTAGITIDEAVGKLRGQPGTDVTIVIRRRGEGKDLDVTITREIIKIKSVPFYGMMDGGIGYVRLVTFSQDAGAEIEKAVHAILAANDDVRGMVLDLRHNPGGLLPQAIEVAEKFLDRKSLIVSTRGRERSQNKEFFATSSPVLPADVPLAVLVDRASASASEIVAGAIQDWDRGVVLGDTTFGKGSVQSILPLDKEHKLKMTTAFYYTPSGRCINRPENDVRGSARNASREEAFEDMLEEAQEGEGSDTAADSTAKAADTTSYRTSAGRVVYGGGGIIPDTVVEAERLSPVIISLFGKDVFFKFATQEYPRMKKRGAAVDESYQVDATTLGAFRSFLDSMKYEFRSAVQMQFGDFLKRAGVVKDTADTADTPQNAWRRTEEALSDDERKAVKAAADRISAVLEGVSQRAVKKDEDEVKRHLTEALLVRALGQDDEVVYRRKLAGDVQLAAALGILRNRKLYNGLLAAERRAEAEQAR